MATSFSWIQTRNKTMTTFAAVHNAILATGMVQTSDTGQLSMASAPTYIATGGTNYGYTVYRFNDAAQSTLPIYFRVDWKNNSTLNATTFSHTLTLGSGSDGAGTITGVYQSATAFIGFASALTASQTGWYTLAAGGDGSGFWLAYAHDDNGATSSNSAGFLIIDRGRNASGVANTTSFIAGWTYPTIQNWQVWSPVAFTGQSPAVGSYAGFPWTVFTTASAGVLPAFPLWYLDPAQQQILTALTINAADFGPFQTFTATHLGSTHTYMAFPLIGTTQAIRPTVYANGGNTHAAALLYE